MVFAVPSVPGKANWSALKNRCDKETNNVEGAQKQGDVDPASEFGVGKYAQIEQKDRYLGKCDGGDVEEFVEVVNLCLATLALHS